MLLFPILKKLNEWKHVVKKDSKKVTIYYSKTEDLVKTMLSLDLSGNKFSEELTVIFNNLSGCPRYS